ncbi:MAG: ribonuclease HII [Chthoniobacterales bacterium]|nr:ribonuclease HII [Chthoniobacterales bacterium]
MRRCGFRHERRLRAAGFAAIAGIDEAGRGALAGPVVAAAVVLPEKFRHKRLNDSKQLLPEKREEIYRDLTNNVAIAWSVGVVDSLEIDELNILRATHKAMRTAVAALQAIPDHALIDGLPVYPFPLPQTAVVDGDCISLSIAAASVIAKVTRDIMMREFCARFPEYCFSQHKGYGTELHLTKLHAHGPCPIHRRSFEPVAQPLFGFARAVSDVDRLDGMADDPQGVAPVETQHLTDSDERRAGGHSERIEAESRNPVAIPSILPLDPSTSLGMAASD